MLQDLALIKVATIAPKHLKQIRVLSAFLNTDAMVKKMTEITRLIREHKVKPLGWVKGEHLPQELPGTFWLVQVCDGITVTEDKPGFAGSLSLYFVPAADPGSDLAREYAGIPQLFV